MHIAISINMNLRKVTLVSIKYLRRNLLSMEVGECEALLFVVTKKYT